MTKKKPKSEHKDRGRPTKITLEVVNKLREYFAQGLSDAEACSMVDIAKPTLYEYCKLNPDFSNQKEELKKRPALKAKLNVVNDIELGDVNTSKWYLERKCKDEFSIRTETTGKDGKDLIPSVKPIELTKDQMDKKDAEMDKDLEK